jgi:hypothetical protein
MAGVWGMGSVVHGAGGSLGQSRSHEVFKNPGDAERRLRENSPVAVAPEPDDER